jgi:hypothetical protein
MFRIRQKQTDTVDAVREKPLEPKETRPLALRIEQLEQRIAPAVNLNSSKSNAY